MLDPVFHGPKRPDRNPQRFHEQYRNHHIYRKELHPRYHRVKIFSSYKTSLAGPKRLALYLERMMWKWLEVNTKAYRRTE